jgi:hypothetical protein
MHQRTLPGYAKGKLENRGCQCRGSESGIFRCRIAGFDGCNSALRLAAKSGQMGAYPVGGWLSPRPKYNGHHTGESSDPIERPCTRCSCRRSYSRCDRSVSGDGCCDPCTIFYWNGRLTGCRKVKDVNIF